MDSLHKKNTDEERRDVGSDSDSASETLSVRSSEGSGRDRLKGRAENSKFFRKRPRQEEGQEPSSGEDDFVSARKIPTSKRGKGREDKSRGRGLAIQKAAEQAETSQRVVVSETSSIDELEEANPEKGALGKLEEAVTAAFKKVALKKLKSSKNRAISEATASILAAAKASGFASTPPASDEVTKLREEVARLAGATESLQKENERLCAELEALRGARPEETPKEGQEQLTSVEVLQSIWKELAAFQSRFSVLEGIVLRPPLAVSKPALAQKGTYAAAAAVAAGPAVPTMASAPSTNVPPAKVPVARAPPAKARPAKPPPVKTPPVKALPAKSPQAKMPPAKVTKVANKPPPPNPADSPADNAEWQVAGEKKKVGKAARAAKKRQRRKERNVAARLRAPKTAAVVITLQPEAATKGVQYRDVLAKVKKAVDLQEFGITEGVRLRITATGARMLEIPGAASGPTADALAEKLRASLNADEARVSRPTKCADMRITGLDDSVTEEEVVAAVVRAGGCSTEQVRAGTLRPDHTGMGTILLRCPVATAKKVNEGRRLLVGWVSAQVKLLEPRPLRCFRCQVGKHVGIHCTSEVDCSCLCFRCGQPGHKAGSCNAAPHCPICAAAGKPAEHRVGSKACAPPAKARGNDKRTATAVSTAAAAPLAAAAAVAVDAAHDAAGPSEGSGEGAEMDCQ